MRKKTEKANRLRWLQIREAYQRVQKQRGLTQADIADAGGLPGQGAVSKIMNNSNLGPTVANMLQAIDELGLSAAEFFALIEPRRKPRPNDDHKRSDTMPTLLADLVQRQTAGALVGVFSRTIDKMAEEMAQDLLRDPAVREQFRTLIQAAFDKALAELQQEAPAPERTSWQERLRILEDHVRDLEQARRQRPPTENTP